MVRKRMIDPQIWTSEDFSRLSVFSRLLWIGLFSQADDEGRGKLNTAYLKSQLFPFDEKVSLKKIENALLEIEQHMSVKFYEIDNKRYYQLLNWKKFQTINRPSPSQIPGPEGKEQSLKIHGVLSECSLNAHEQINGASHPKKEIEKEIENKERENKNARAREDEFKKTLSQSYPGILINADIDEKIDLEKLLDAIRQSDFLQKSPLSFIFKNYEKVINNYYKTITTGSDPSFSQRSYSKEELNGLFTNLEEDL